MPVVEFLREKRPVGDNLYLAENEENYCLLRKKNIGVNSLFPGMSKRKVIN